MGLCAVNMARCGGLDVVSVKVSAATRAPRRRGGRADSREWAIIVPCWLMVVVLLTYWSYTALTAFLVPGFDSPAVITGELRTLLT